MNSSSQIISTQTGEVRAVANVDEMLRALAILRQPGEVTELRVIRKGRKQTDAGYYDCSNWPGLAASAEAHNPVGSPYITLNPVNPQLLSRYNNRMQQYADATATDRDITHRSWMLVDIDPIRPKNTSATDAQLQAAVDLATAVESDLQEHGFPEPVVAMSGNGMHLLYRVDLPNTDTVRDIVKDFLGWLGTKFDNNLVNIDRSVFNAGRIIKLYGTVANKGDDTPAAPHRTSHIVSVPVQIAVLTLEAISACLPVKVAPKTQMKQASSSPFDLHDFLQRLGIGFSQDLHHGVERYLLEYCPFNPEHGKGESAIFRQQSGTLGFKCQHASCSDYHWRDLRELVDGPRGRHTTGREESSKEGKARKSQTELGLDVAADLVLFHDENRDAFCFLNGQCLPVKDREVKSFIAHKIYKLTKRAISSSSLQEVITTLEGKARCEGPEKKLHNRIAVYDGCFWYDLGDDRCVKIQPGTWEVVKAPILFRRYGHQQVQDIPKAGGDPWALFEFLNIAPDHRLETLVLLISFLVPDIAHPIFHPHGAQGSGKTTLFKMIKRLLDPSSLEAIIAPKDRQELIRQIARHHIPLFDNLSRIDGEMSDILCMACTGGGITKRVLYTDDDDCIYNFKRCIGINGINLLISRPDLLDRTMLLQIERITPELRREESELWLAYGEAKPGILGGMFDALAKAVQLHPQVKLPNLPRLADFARWGYAIGESLGTGKGEQFVAAYKENVRRQNAEVVQNNSLCLAITRFMTDRDEWEGTVKTAFQMLHVLAEPSRSDTTFPADAKNLRRHLARIQTTLIESEGIGYRMADKPMRDGYHLTFFRTVEGLKACSPRSPASNCLESCDLPCELNGEVGSECLPSSLSRKAQ